MIRDAIASTGGNDSPVARFWRWWIRELHDAAPASLRRMFADERPVLRVRVDARHAGIDLCDSQGTNRVADIITADCGDGLPDEVREVIAAASSEAGPAIVIVDESLVLRRRVELPLDAQENLDAVVGFELDRFVPFAPGDSYYDYRIAGKDAERRVLETDLTVVRRSDIDTTLALLADAGLAVMAMTLSDDPLALGSGKATTNLLPKEQRQERRNDSLHLTSILAVASIALLVVSIGLPFWELGRVGARLENDLEALRTEAQAAAGIREQIDGVVAKSGFIAAEREANPLVIAILNELTAAVPDDTWIGRIELNAATVRLHGESESASALISLVEGSDMFENARFSAPVTKNNRTNLDRFVLEADIGGEEEDE